MKILKNGAWVIHSTEVDHDCEVTLGYWHKNWPGSDSKEYVTWLTDKNGNAYLGHYFRDFFAAVNDYKERIRREKG